MAKRTASDPLVPRGVSAPAVLDATSPLARVRARAWEPVWRTVRASGRHPPERPGEKLWSQIEG